MLARHGIAVLLDFHQDMYNEKYAGEGFPDWAVIDDAYRTFPSSAFRGTTSPIRRRFTPSTISG